MIQNRRRFVASVAGAGMSYTLRANAGKPLGTRFEKRRKRRVIYNDDADEQYSGYEKHLGYRITGKKSFIAARLGPTFNSHVDTLAWCLGNGADPPWGEQAGHQVWPFIGDHRDATKLVVEACHKKGMEVWGSLRMNDLHDSFMAKTLEETFDPVKAQHPEYLIGDLSSRRLPEHVMERHLWSAFNYAHPAVRQYRLEFIERTASEHDLDGYELDFTRMPVFFPPGEGRASAELMTSLVRDIREKLTQIGMGRLRPYTLVVHVLDSPRISLDVGLDVRKWLAEGLVDVLVVGLGYLPYEVRLGEWLSIGKQYGVPVYPSVNTNTYAVHWRKRFGRAVFREAIRAHASYYWHQGVDGLYLFNFFPQGEAVPSRELTHQAAHSLLNEIGEPALLRDKDQLYSIQPASQGSWFVYRSETSALPIALDSGERTLPLDLGPEKAHGSRKHLLRLWTTGGIAETRVWVRVNFRLLGEMRKSGQWYEVEVPAEFLRPGYNRLNLWCDRPLAETQQPLIADQVFLSV